MKMTRDRWTAILMLLPSVVLLGVFVYGFIGQTAWTSLTDWGRNPAQALAIDPVIEYVGWQNYRDLFTGFIDVRFRQDLVNTFFFTIFFLAGCLGVGLWLAFLLDQEVAGEGFFRTLFLFPMSLSFVVTGTAWRWMLQPRGGLNVLPTTIGLEPLEFRWLTDRTQTWRFDWNALPSMTGLLVAVVLAWVAIAAWRDRHRTRAGVALLSAATVGLWSLTWARDVVLLPYPKLHGFNLAFIGIILAAVWQMSGYTMALYLAGLRGIFLRSIGLYGGLPGLILAHVVYGLPITTLIFRNYYAEIPDEMLEAGKIDGAGFFGLYGRIVFPLSLPGFVVVIIWQFTQIWNEFLFAVTLTSQANQPITVALAQLAGGEAVRWNLPMAGAILAALPTLLVYVLLGRYFVKGLLAGSVKG